MELMKTNARILLSAFLAAASATAILPARAQFREALPSTRDLSSYAEKKAQAEDQIEFFRKKANDASKQYAAAVRAGSPAESDKWNVEATQWDAQLKGAQARLAELEAGAARAARVELTRPTEETLPRLKFSEAQAKLAELEEFRAAEGALVRRGPRLEADPAARTNLRTAQAELARLDEASAAPRSVGAAGGNIQQDLDRLTTRKAQLEQEVERWNLELADWDTRYKALQAELARLESENKARPQLEAVRGELASIEAEIQRTQAQLRAAQAEAERRTLAQSRSASDDLIRTTEGGPSRRFYGGSATASEGSPVKRTQVTMPTPQTPRELERLADRKDQLQREVDDVEPKWRSAVRDLTSAQKLGNATDIDRWSKEVSAFDSRLRSAKGQLDQLDSEVQSKQRPMTTTKTFLEPTPTMPLADGDSLQLMVQEDESLNGTYPVRRGGYIVMQRVGRINVNGMDVPTAEKAIKETLEATQLRQATVIIERTRPDDRPNVDIIPPDPVTGEVVRRETIYLAGEFVNAGQLRVTEDETPTLIKTILRSGGLTPSADLTRVKLLRFDAGRGKLDETGRVRTDDLGRGRVEEINVQAILSGSAAPTDWPLASGDIIMVPSFAPVVYVTGNVQKPGTLRLFQDETMTVYSAILRSGSFTRFANPKKVYVVREIGNGEKAKIPVNINEVQEGKVPDIILQGRDIVVVPERFWSL